MSGSIEHSIAEMILKLRTDLAECDRLIRASSDTREADRYHRGINEILEHVDSTEAFLEHLSSAARGDAKK